MAGPLFVGHPRPVWKVVVLQLVTLGIYGRVWLYQSVREIDGHKVWFLDLNLYLVGVILPIGGPLVVKWKLVTHTRNMLAEEVAMPRVRSAALRWAALLAWIPVYHGFVQRHLNRYWVFNRKLADIEARRAVLEEQRKSARTPAQREKLKEFENEIQERAQAIDSARGAAVALRDARLAREATMETSRARRARPSLMAKLSPKGLVAKVLKRAPKDETDAATEEQAPDAAPKRGRFSVLTSRLPFGKKEPEAEEAAAPKPAPETKGRKKRARAEPQPEPAPVDEPPASKKGKRAKEEPVAAEPEQEGSAGEEKVSFWAKRKAQQEEKRARKAEEEAKAAAEAPPKEAEPEKPAKPSRKERKKLRILEKERQRREKEAAKEAALHEKLQKRIEKRTAKAAAAQEPHEAPAEPSRPPRKRKK